MTFMHFVCRVGLETQVVCYYFLINCAYCFSQETKKCYEFIHIYIIFIGPTAQSSTDLQETPSLIGLTLTCYTFQLED